MTDFSTPHLRDEHLDGPHGDLRVRIYGAAGAARAGLVWVHGGAFAFGDLDMPESDQVGRQLAAAGIAVIAVDYRLAPIPESIPSWGDPRPGAQFPVASEEVTAAFLWAATESGLLGPGVRWSLGGASAGANLAAGAALRIRDQGFDSPPASVVLAYPLVHPGLPPMTGELAAKAAALAPEERFEPDSVRDINRNYVGDERLFSDPYAFAGEGDLEGFPPTLILNSEHDTLRASGQQFAAQLALAGVRTSVLFEPGTLHGHLDRLDDPTAIRSIRRIADWIDAVRDARS